MPNPAILPSLFQAITVESNHKLAQQAMHHSACCSTDPGAPAPCPQAAASVPSTTCQSHPQTTQLPIAAKPLLSVPTLLPQYPSTTFLTRTKALPKPPTDSCPLLPITWSTLLNTNPFMASPLAPKSPRPALNSSTSMVPLRFLQKHQAVQAVMDCANADKQGRWIPQLCPISSLFSPHALRRLQGTDHS
jgi:hypothetical protein